MSLTKQQLQHMDQVSGLSDADVKKMDQVVGGGKQSQTPLQDVNNKVQQNPLMQAANFLAPAIGSNMSAMANQMDYMKNQPNAKGDIGQSFQNALGATGNLATQLPGVAFNDALSIIGGKGIKQVATHPLQTAQAVGSAIKTGGQLLTKKGAANITTKAAQEATAAGKGMHWDQLQSQIENAVKKQLGDNGEIRGSLNNLLAEKTPAGIESIPKSMIKTPEELLQWRRQIGARANTGVLANLFKGTNVDDKVSSIARRVISENVHKLAPGTIHADKAYSLWSKLKGSPAEWGARAAIGATAGKALKGMGIPESAVGDALISLVSGAII